MNENCNIALTRKSDVGVDVLHPVHLLQLPGQVAVHDLHLLLQPVQYMVIVSISIIISSSSSSSSSALSSTGKICICFYSLSNVNWPWSYGEQHHFHPPHHHHYHNHLQNDNPLLKPGLQSVLISFCGMIVLMIIINNENKGSLQKKLVFFRNTS